MGNQEAIDREHQKALDAQMKREEQDRRMRERRIKYLQDARKRSPSKAVHTVIDWLLHKINEPTHLVPRNETDKVLMILASDYIARKT
jgi:hypothetical protein